MSLETILDCSLILVSLCVVRFFLKIVSSLDLLDFSCYPLLCGDLLHILQNLADKNLHRTSKITRFGNFLTERNFKKTQKTLFLSQA